MKTRDAIEYRIWGGMVQWCENPNSKSWHRYGGRGIGIHKSWRGPGGFERFLAHVGKRPSARHSIDRIDNDGDYEPGNVRWATQREQQRNRSTNRPLEHDDRTMLLVEWAEETGLDSGTIEYRLRAGWSIHDALTMPPDKGNMLTAGDETMTQAEWARRAEMSPQVLCDRLKRMSLEEALAREVRPRKRRSPIG